MSYRVTLRENSTGIIRIYELNDLNWEDHSLFWWTEGNFACDCNRELCWLRAGGPGPSNDPHYNNVDTECGDERYSVLYADLPDGTRLTIDEE